MEILWQRPTFLRVLMASPEMRPLVTPLLPTSPKCLLEMAQDLLPLLALLQDKALPMVVFLLLLSEVLFLMLQFLRMVLQTKELPIRVLLPKELQVRVLKTKVLLTRLLRAKMLRTRLLRVRALRVRMLQAKALRVRMLQAKVLRVRVLLAKVLRVRLLRAKLLQAKAC